MPKNVVVTSNSISKNSNNDTGSSTKEKKEKFWIPTAKQQEVADRLAMPMFDGYTKKQIIKSAGISTKTFYEWVRDKNFIDYVNKLVEQYDNISLREAWKALRKRVRAGDTAAIRLYFELKGKVGGNKLNVRTTVPGEDGDIIVEVTLEDEEDN